MPFVQNYETIVVGQICNGVTFERLLYRLEEMTAAKSVLDILDKGNHRVKSLESLIFCDTIEDMAPIYVKHYPTKIVIENPGGFPGDINESNIITHQSIPRNKLIAMTLQHLKYAQRSGQVVDIMVQSMLTEGKPYPEYASTPNSVRLPLRSTMENQSFVRFIAETQDKTVSQIQAKDRILEYLKHKPSITNQKAQELCGFNKNQTYYILHQMRKDGILQPDGVGRGTKYKSVK